MQLPAVERVIYDRAPLVSVLAQVRFPTILRIGIETPVEFQERVRRIYPIYALQEARGGVQIPSQLSSLLPNLPAELAAAFQGGGSRSHRFAREDGKRFITLSPDAMAYSDAAYEVWEVFLEELQRAEAALRQVFEPAFYSRVGLRYQDIFRRSRIGVEHVPWRDLLNEHVLGPLADNIFADGVAEMTGTVGLQIPSLPQGRARVQYGLVDVDGEKCFRLDVDVFTTERTKPDDAVSVFNEFNGIARGVFRHVLKPALHQAMGPKPFDGRGRE